MNSPEASVELIKLNVNGAPASAQVEERTSLADMLRDGLDLTGTHLGCEQGVCGACTIEVDGVPSRSCTLLATRCRGAQVRTIEGYDGDAVMDALRDAFSEHHALQCGFCTPGMLVSSRDIIMRGLPLDEQQVRMALSGNLCRCTGYMGIVQAVMSVLARRDELLSPEQRDSAEPVPEHQYSGPLPTFERSCGKVEMQAAPVNDAGGDRILELIKLKHSRDDVWALMRNVEQVVSCVPGASLLAENGDQLEIQMEASFGAISASFKGEGRFTFDDASHSGRFEGQGKDSRSGSGASGAMDFSLEADGDGCILHLEASYAITGALSQFSRGGLVKSFASAVTRMFADNLSARLRGETPNTSAAAKLSVFKLIVMVVKGWFRR